MKRIYCILIFGLLLYGCGVKGRPTGGKEDLDKPQIVSTLPLVMGEITDGIIEIDFSKAMDKSSLPNAIYIYPPVLNKSFSISRQSLKIELKEPLLKDTYYYITLTNRLKDLRGNALSKNHSLVFKHGNPEGARISGIISYEELADNGSPIQMSLLAGDSLLVMQDEISGSSFELPPLQAGGYQLRTYIDKNLNGRYDESQEPFFEKQLALKDELSLEIVMAYVETTWAQVRRVQALSPYELEISFSKPVLEYSHFVITDSENAAVEIRHEHLEADKLRVLCAELNSGDYRVQMQNLLDKKGNISPASSISFSIKELKDESPPRLISSTPRNGSTVDNLQPVMQLNFNKIMPRANLQLSMVESDSQREIPLEIVATKGRSVLVKPVRDLVNYRTYTLKVGAKTADPSGNELGEDIDIQILAISRR